MQSGGWWGRRRREVLNTTETELEERERRRRTRSSGGRDGVWGRGEGGRETRDHSFTFFLHFYFRHWKRKQKKSAKRERKVITSQLAGTKRRISRRM